MNYSVLFFLVQDKNAYTAGRYGLTDFSTRSSTKVFEGIGNGKGNRAKVFGGR